MSLSVVLINLMNVHILPPSFDCISCFFTQLNLVNPSPHMLSLSDACLSPTQPEWMPLICAPTVSLYILVTLSCGSGLLVFSPPTWQGFEVNDHVLFSILNMVSNLVSHI